MRGFIKPSQFSFGKDHHCSSEIFIIFVENENMHAPFAAHNTWTLQSILSVNRTLLGNISTRGEMWKDLRTASLEGTIYEILLVDLNSSIQNLQPWRSGQRKVVCQVRVPQKIKVSSWPSLVKNSFKTSSEFLDIAWALVFSLWINRS